MTVDEARAAKAELDFFAPFVTARLETTDGELVHVAQPPREAETVFPVAIGYRGRVFNATFQRKGKAHIFTEVTGEKRELTKRTCAVYEV